MDKDAERVTVRKLDHAGRQILAHKGVVLRRESNAIVLRTTWERPPLDLGYVVLETGSRWTEYFFATQWYNIFEICASDGHLQGWYCNITRPARITTGEANEVAAEDLALDLWAAARHLSVHAAAEDLCRRLGIPAPRLASPRSSRAS